jgi:membrane protease YdiL (CAAX protease family)
MIDMNKLTNWIKNHQVAAFFIITFTITWGLGFSYSAVLQQGQFLLFPLVVIATCGPALAGIIITAITNTEPRQGTRRAVWIAFLVAWVISTLVCVTNLTFIEQVPLSPAVVGLFTISVAPVAFIIASAYSRIPSVKNYLASLIQLRGVWGWSLLALGLFPALFLLSILISYILGRQPMVAPQFPATGLALIGMVAVKFFYQLFFFNATGEEIGWRGFALPRLQSRTSPLIASLVIAFFWINWHLFLWQAEGNPMFSWSYWMGQYALHIPASVIICWFYNRSKGSILVAGIAHAAANTASAFFPNLDWMIYILIAAVAMLVMILFDRMWQRLPHDHPAVYQAPLLDS